MCPGTLGSNRRVDFGFQNDLSLLACSAGGGWGYGEPQSSVRLETVLKTVVSFVLLYLLKSSMFDLIGSNLASTVSTLGAFYIYAVLPVSFPILNALIAVLALS